MSRSSVQLSQPSRRKCGIAFSAGKTLTFIFLFEHFLSVYVIHFNVWAPALSRKNFVTTIVSTSEMGL
jgi:hypothetical protein